TVRASGHSY
nr:Chain C, Synthetic peptide THR-VAL-ARG-ALA-SER-GLY-HIS-SER-TYR [synthetic construct]6UZQ_C Chain C, Synthetic peptide THR-VAL-ARG-ALA-SER-GLY-HIS-SER-TYR [synthetic construct]6VB5_C Chain C, Synthetic peptide THR-VAL-ARG-ALA-SER-GLY-HIS-SER-TYR [synthetic construct]6VB6_C Chain C, Synthetic peptide THR-VAL-ARG-ALA-SER-GLY-HIS-SER-TYR [synthetic construct]6VB7_C Chain C, Synthetic peptide THR-VAL-ARG-ALA-SER-GLY-HIS-SER-TYR [synthetic construct]